VTNAFHAAQLSPTGLGLFDAASGELGIGGETRHEQDHNRQVNKDCDHFDRPGGAWLYK
jgi:hypothetical protein